MSDKTKHLAVCFCLTLVFGSMFGVAVGAGVSLAAGVAKEVWDSRPGGTGWDWMDLDADAAGALCGTVALVTIKLLAGV